MAQNLYRGGRVSQVRRKGRGPAKRVKQCCQHPSLHTRLEVQATATRSSAEQNSKMSSTSCSGGVSVVASARAGRVRVSEQLAVA